jgi:hypothetical protein
MNSRIGRGFVDPTSTARPRRAAERVADTGAADLLDA